MGEEWRLHWFILRVQHKEHKEHKEHKVILSPPSKSHQTQKHGAQLTFPSLSGWVFLSSVEDLQTYLRGHAQRCACLPDVSKSSHTDNEVQASQLLSDLTGRQHIWDRYNELLKPLEAEQGGTGLYRVTRNGKLFKPYKLFTSGIFHLIFLDYSSPEVTIKANYSYMVGENVLRTQEILAERVWSY